MKENGLVFQSGYWNGTIIKKLSFNPTLTLVDTEVSTTASQTILIELFEWAKTELGANFTPNSIRRWAFVSDIIFQSDFPLLLELNNALNPIAVKVANAVQENLRETLDFQPSLFQIGHDPQKRTSAIAPFSIQHRANSLYEENIFFAEAPVPTSLHLELLEELEAEFTKSYVGR